jgi:glycerol kinase
MQALQQTSSTSDQQLAPGGQRMPYILTIDQGTTGSRAIAYDREGQKQASAYREFSQYYPHPGWVEHDPNEIWESVSQTIDTVLDTITPSEIVALSITNQRETTVLWDRTTGEPVHNAIVWQCRRTSARCDELKALPGMAERITEKTGLPIDAYFSASKLEWLLDNVPDCRARAERGDLCFGTIDSWILWKLTGGAVHATEFTNASRTMLFNIDERCWDADLLDIFSIPRSVLPEVQTSSGTFGITAACGKLPAGIPVAGIAGDQQAALFGQACFTPGSIKNTYGTGSFVLCNVGNKRPHSRHGLIVTLACGPDGSPVYALEGSIFVAGSAVQWLRDKLGLLDDAAESEQMAESVPDTAGVYFVPALVGLGAPYWDQDARGLICGITRGTTDAHIIRATLEAMCYQTRDVMDAMRDDTGLSFPELRVDGGATANNFLCQYQADILGIDVVRPKVIESTSLGSAYLAGLAVGYWADATEIERFWGVDRQFSPSMDTGIASERYDGWRTAVARTRPMPDA